MPRQITELKKKPESIDFYRTLGIKPIPYQTSLSFVPLIDYINECCTTNNFVEVYWTREINELLKQSPELLQPVEDLQLARLQGVHGLRALRVTVRI